MDKRTEELLANFGTSKSSLCVLEILNAATLSDVYGKDVQQILQSHVSDIIKNHLGARTPVSMIAVGRFVFMADTNDKKELTSKLKTLLDAVSLVDNAAFEGQLVLSLQLGVASMEGIAPQTAYIRAHVGVSHARARHQEYKICFYEDSQEAKAETLSNMRIAAYLMQAMREGRTVLAFQPVVDARTGVLDKYEALLRVIDEEGNLISAGPFIAATELLGYIHIVDNMVLELVIEELRKSPQIRLGMNISNMSVDNKTWINKAKAMLQDEQISQRLTIEITETGTYHGLDKMAYLVDMLKSLGCSVAIDDFGAGYTSFKQLKVLHADYIKIDGAFIRNVVDDEDSKLFVSTMITFAKSFGIKSVAEFVENGEIAKVLLELGVDYMQGNYFSPALNYRPWIEND
ncbi:MAG: EAL domain-containing protein [Proteobacteria bacterium]|nr:EAL domain-containing protein [Pseudomonadota bacterium]